MEKITEERYKIKSKYFIVIIVANVAFESAVGNLGAAPVHHQLDAWQELGTPGPKGGEKTTIWEHTDHLQFPNSMRPLGLGLNDVKLLCEFTNS